MRTDRSRRVAALAAGLVALVGASPRAAAEPFANRFELGFFPEVTVIGLAGGARAELYVRPGPPGTASRLRLAPGFLVGPEFNYFPLALGYRAVWRSTKIVQPLLGTGFEYQMRWVSDADPARQIAWYGETGILFGVRHDVAVGLVAGIDWTFFGGPGAGIVARLGVTWTPGATRPPGPRAW